MIFTDRVKDITYQEIMPTLVDFVNNSNIFTARVMSNVKSWKGITMQQPITIANSTTGSSFDGLDTFDTNTTNNTRIMTWYVKAYEQSVVVPGIEKAVNGNTEKQVLSLVATRLDEAKNSLANSIGDLLYGTGTGKNIEGLGAFVDSVGGATTQYAGISRSELSSINAGFYDTTTSTLSLKAMANAYDGVSAAGAEEQSPTIDLTTKAIFSIYEGLLNTTIHANYELTSAKGYNVVSGKTPMGVSVPATELNGATGFNSISYRGKPLVADDKCPSGSIYFLNERYIEFRRLLSDDLKSVSNKNQITDGVYKNIEMPSFLQLRDFMSPVNQFGEIGALIVMGNLICRQPRRNGAFKAIAG